MKTYPWKDVVEQRRALEAAQGVSLARLRSKFLGLTQKEAAAKTGMAQSGISKLEHRGDHRLSTLRKYIEALDGKLEVVAVFDGRAIRLRV